MYLDILAIIEIIKLGAEAVEAIADIIDTLNEIEDLFTVVVEPTYADLPYDLRVQLLRRCTKIIVNLGLDVNCYPLGYTTTLLFDLDGNLIP